MDSNYFVCTLGQAAQRADAPSDLGNINHFIDRQASGVPQLPAVSFPYVNESEGAGHVKSYTFQGVDRGSRFVAHQLAKALPSLRTRAQTVALLSSSSPEFLFTWLGLIRLGCSVLLVAPQCQAPAVSHLCSVCSVHVLLHDPIHEKLSDASVSCARESGALALTSLALPTSTEDPAFKSALQDQPIEPIEPPRQATRDSIAYLFHTSGTSSGLPKPIPQSHNAAVVALPHFPEGHKASTFSTTPLYHGGIADMFRAWTSDAMIWLFPGVEFGEPSKSIPITTNNVNACLDLARSHDDFFPPVRYFSSVPFVLQMVFADHRGVEHLKGMECVGVGGAALPPNTGDEIVQQGINLVSRYGSAECGFLMSSHRKYNEDKDWQFFRANSGSESLRFEPRDDGRFELVVGPEWPHRAKQNRSDDSFATSDLFIPHGSIPNAWKYDSRADSQLTLITGKKFDPSPLESSIATSELVDDVLIFGNQRPFPGALLFRSAASAEMSDQDMIESLMPAIEKLNMESQDHARLPREMLLPIPLGANELQKSSKGTIMRGKAEEQYAGEIEAVYRRLESSIGERVPDEEVANAIQTFVRELVGTSVGVDDDLLSHGVNSIVSMQIRYKLKRLLFPGSDDLPLSIVEDRGTINRLAAWISNVRSGQPSLDSEDELQLMDELVHELGSFEGNRNFSPTGQRGMPQKEVILLTGVTGGLGAHVLDQYRRSSSVSLIVCLVRGSDNHAAKERVVKSLSSRKLAPISRFHNPDASQDQLTQLESLSKDHGEASLLVLPYKASEPHLGLAPDVYEMLANSVTKIVHAAWAVNFRMRLRSFVREHVAGLRHVLDFALLARNPPQIAFVSSTASVSNFSAPAHDKGSLPGLVPESRSQSPKDASQLGYSRSKWVAEQICHKAEEQCPSLRGRITIMRVGQLSGATTNGIWNMQEAWPLMLSSVKATACLPDLDESLSWLPVDVAAKAVIQALNANRGGQELGTSEDGLDSERVLHIVNNDRTTRWSDLLQWMHEDGVLFEVVQPREWVKRLEPLQKQRHDHPALRLLGMWQERYAPARGEDDPESADDLRDEPERMFDSQRAKQVSPALAHDMKPVDKEHGLKLWTWIESNAEA